jgi:hypothetical protein
MAREPDARFPDYRALRHAFQDVENFRCEEGTAEMVAAPRPVCIPRSGRDSQTLHGILARTKSQWTVQEENSAGLIRRTRAQVLDAIKNRIEPLKLQGLTGTIAGLCRSQAEDPAALAEAMEKVPGFGPAVRALFDFMVSPQQESEKASHQEAAVIIETIGLERCHNLALTFFALNYDFPPAGQFDWTPLWRHQITVGVVIDFLYDVLNLKRSGIEYAAGLVHDLGKILLAELFPFAYFTVLNRAFQEEISLKLCETSLFGIDHAELAVLWLRDEELPPALADAIALHETPEKIHRRAVLAQAVVCANHLVKQIGIGFSGNPLLDARPWEELPATVILWEARGNKEYPFEDFTRDILGQFGQFPDLI